MNQPFDDLSGLFEAAWSLLLRGKSDRKHPYAFPVLATTSPSSHPRSRTLVLRNALKDSAELWCYTDLRSGKAVDSAAASWTFWSPRARIQVNASGPTDWLGAARTDDIFQSIPKHSRKAYATIYPPGSATESLTDGLPRNWEDLTAEETNYAAANFGVLVTTIQEMDILQLHRDGHRRMRATRTGGEWVFTWLIP